MGLGASDFLFHNKEKKTNTQKWFEGTMAKC